MQSSSDSTIIPGAHDGAGLRERAEVDGHVGAVRGDEASRGAAGLDRLQLAVVEDAAADVEDDVLQRRAERDLDEARVLDLAGEGEDLRPAGIVGPDLREPVAAEVDDGGDVRERLDVVDAGRLAPEPRRRREGGPHARLAALALDRPDEGRLLAADERARALDYLYVEIKTGVEDVLSEQSVLLCVLDGLP